MYLGEAAVNKDHIDEVIETAKDLHHTRGFPLKTNPTYSTHQNSETKPFETNVSITNEKILKSEIKRLKLELEKKAKVEVDFNKLELFNKEIETENKKLKKELIDQENKYVHKCGEIKTLKEDIKPLKRKPREFNLKLPKFLRRTLKL